MLVKIRNNDNLPKPLNVKLEDYQAQRPNAENFWMYISNEVIPLIESKFRTTNRRFAIGHSLSASFVLDKMLADSNCFKGCISISPNLAYDNFRLAHDFINTDFDKPDENKYIYISQANELTTWAQPWKTGYEIISSFLEKNNSLGKYTIHTKEFVENGHWDVYLPSTIQGLKGLMQFMESNPYKLTGKRQQITLKVVVPDSNDDILLENNLV